MVKQVPALSPNHWALPAGVSEELLTETGKSLSTAVFLIEDCLEYIAIPDGKVVLNRPESLSPLGLLLKP